LLEAFESHLKLPDDFFKIVLKLPDASRSYFEFPEASEAV